MNLPAASIVAPEASAAASPKPLVPPQPTQPLKSSQPVPKSPAKPLAPPENSSHPAERDAFEDLLPEPELDFSNAPIPGERPDDDRYSIYKPLRKKVGVRDAILVVATTLLLAGGIGFAWYKDKLPMARRNTPAPAPAAAVKTAPAAKSATPASSPANGPATTPTPSTPASAPGGVPTDAKSAEAGAGAAPISSESANSAAGSESTTAPPVTPTALNQRSTALPALSKKRKATTASAQPAPDAPEPAADAPVLPVKLVRAAKPVYPPDAMRNFITGDVRITAEVGADGGVGKVTVISGPAALRAAAIAAMKHYEYEPATKGGKPVPSQVTATIKFWFDP
jgi:TonB family protein